MNIEKKGEPVYVVTLTKEEAQVLADITTVIGGARSGPRRVVDDLGKGLREQGIECIGPFTRHDDSTIEDGVVHLKANYPRTRRG